ncbi:MAG: YceD family protein [Roseinatronobacter sp.]
MPPNTIPPDAMPPDAPAPHPFPQLTAPLRVAALGSRRVHSIALAPEADARAQIAAALDLLAVRKFRFEAQLHPVGKRDWELRGQLGATVVQPCAVTLEPVTTRIDEPVTRHLVADFVEPEAQETEMPEDDTLEPLGDEIDVSAIALEALSLALPAFPRALGATISDAGEIAAVPPGAGPIPPRELKPFAALAALRDRLAQASEGDETPDSAARGAKTGGDPGGDTDDDSGGNTGER